MEEINTIKKDDENYDSDGEKMMRMMKTMQDGIFKNFFTYNY